MLKGLHVIRCLPVIPSVTFVFGQQPFAVTSLEQYHIIPKSTKWSDENQNSPQWKPHLTQTCIYGVTVNWSLGCQCSVALQRASLTAGWQVGVLHMPCTHTTSRWPAAKKKMDFPSTWLWEAARRVIDHHCNTQPSRNRQDQVSTLRSPSSGVRGVPPPQAGTVTMAVDTRDRQGLVMLFQALVTTLKHAFHHSFERW